MPELDTDVTTITIARRGQPTATLEITGPARTLVMTKRVVTDVLYVRGVAPYMITVTVTGCSDEAAAVRDILGEPPQTSRGAAAMQLVTPRDRDPVRSDEH